jgi:hypothetical protein
MSRFAVSGLTMMLAFAPAALAVDGTVLINQSTITSGLPGCPTGGHFPIIICQPGSYRLSGNLAVPDANTTAIQITAPDVTIDLNGFAIVGPGGKGNGIGILVIRSTVSDALNNTSVSNGTIRGMGSSGIDLVNGRVYKIQAIANGSDGIDALGDSLVSECISNFNGGEGINLGGTAMNNIANGNAGDGITSVFPAVVTGNKVVSNAANGINVENGLVSGNVANFNSKAGIQVTCPANIVGNHLFGNGSGIVTLFGGCQLVNNN